MFGPIVTQRKTKRMATNRFSAGILEGGEKIRSESDGDKALSHCDNERLQLRREAAVCPAEVRDDGTSPLRLHSNHL